MNRSEHESTNSGDRIAAYIAAYKVPLGVFVLDALPRTDTGKLRKDLLAARLPAL